MSLVFHVKRIISLNCINYNFLRKLNSQSVFVNSDLLYVVSAPDLDSRLSYQMLDYDVCHQFSVCISFLVKAMNTLKLNCKVSKRTIVCTREDWFSSRMNRCTPNPVSKLTYFSKPYAFFVPQSYLFVTSSKNKVFSGWIERNWTRIKS